MTRKFRMLMVGAASLVTLVFAGAAYAAFTPTLAIGQTPPTAGSSATSFRLTVPRDDDALASSVVLCPGWVTRPRSDQAAGTQLGTVTAQILVREPIAGAVLPLTGTISVANPADLVRPTNRVDRDHCHAMHGNASHTAIWLATLQAAGQTLDVPIAIDAAAAPVSGFASYVMTLCLPTRTSRLRRVAPRSERS